MIFNFTWGRVNDAAKAVVLALGPVGRQSRGLEHDEVAGVSEIVCQLGAGLVGIGGPDVCRDAVADQANPSVVGSHATSFNSNGVESSGDIY